MERKINPKNLKIGDILMCDSNTLVGFTKGKKYIVEGFYNRGYGITTIGDNNSKHMLCNDLVKNNFSLAINNSDNVNHPSHYIWLKDKCGIEVIDITRHMDFCLGNAIKYVLRAGHKKDASLSDNQKEIEDLKKAVWYIKDRIKQLGGEIE